MADPFAQDAARRQALMERVYEVRLALHEAHEAQDGAAALAALGKAYALLERIEGSQLLYVGDVDPQCSTAFAMPHTCRQIVARYGGRCSLCDERFSRGDVVYYDTEDRVVFCMRCSMQELLGASR